MRTQAEKAIAFQALHMREGALIIPTTLGRLLAHLGYEALATTSAGYVIHRGVIKSKCNSSET